jgi:hypothetical protein
MIQPGNGLPFMPLSGYQDMSKDVYSWLSKSQIEQFQQQQEEYEKQMKKKYEPEDVPPKFNYNINSKANIYEGSYHSNYKASDV